MEDMLERITLLEKAVQRLTKFVIAAFAVIPLLSYYVLRPFIYNRMLCVRRLEVVDREGKALIVFSTNPFGQPVILVHDNEGHARFGISLDESGNAMAAVFDADGNIVAKLGK